MSPLRESRRRETIPHVEEVLRSLGMESFFDLSAVRREEGSLTGTIDGPQPPHTLSDLVQWLDDIKSENHFFVKREGLKTLQDWQIDGRGHFIHRQHRFFRVVGMKISSCDREVFTWSQPILDNEGSGIIGLLLKKVDGETYYLMQAKAEVGNRNIIQIGPTVQFNPGNYIDNSSAAKPFLFDEFINPEGFIPLFETRQSEEGGRFFREDHLHRVLMLPEGADLDLPPEYKWFSRDQILFFLHMGDMVNSCARSILACVV